MTIQFTVNGKAASTDAPPQTPLLWVIREGLSPNASHPVQKAWLAESVPQCGYCQSGQIMSAADLLQHNPNPTRAQIIEHMSTNICRCGTYQRIVRAVERAAGEA